MLVRGLQCSQSLHENRGLTGHFDSSNPWYAFVAPEVDADFSYDKSVDLWSLGATLYMLLTGKQPFVRGSEKRPVIFDGIHPSQSARDLVQRLLQVKPGLRMTIEEVLRSKWMLERDEVLAKCDLMPALRAFRDAAAAKK